MSTLKQRFTAPLSNPDNSPEKQEAYCKKLEGLTDDFLVKETKGRIWLSAFADNNPRSCYHWQVDACYAEAVRRGAETLYRRAYDEVYKENFG